MGPGAGEAGGSVVFDGPPAALAGADTATGRSLAPRRGPEASWREMEILILKIGALGDVLRTTSILPGLRSAHPEARVTWLMAEGAQDLVRHHPQVDRIRTVDPECAASCAAAVEELSGVDWARILSLDDEESACALATSLARGRAPGVLSGAYLTQDGACAYTEDTAPWFDMGLLSTLERDAADELKKQNTETHPALFARMLGIEAGESRLVLPPEAEDFARRFLERESLREGAPLIGISPNYAPPQERRFYKGKALEYGDGNMSKSVRTAGGLPTMPLHRQPGVRSG